MSANLTTRLSDNWRSWPPEAKVRLLEKLQGQSGSTDLQSALRTCIAAESQIDAEQQRIQALWNAAVDPVERDARSYQYDLVARKLERFAAVARWRLKHLNALTKAAWPDEHAKCASRIANVVWLDPWGQRRETTGLIYWFALYAWAYDPRDTIKTQPFYPFDFQERLLARIDDAVFNTRSSLLIDKSRDMGVTWLLALWKLYHWRYTPGFAALSGNRTEDEVDDSKGDFGATFNKLRFQLKLMPAEMMPRSYDDRRHNTYMNLTNPETGANISGGAPVEDFGRGDRRTVIDPDEFASWKETKGHKQYQAMSQTTNSLIIASTVKGVFNKYGELLLNPAMPKFVVDWRDHPWKDERWYNSLPHGYLGPPMSAVEIAQEVDRDPYASQPGQVLWMWDEVRHIITYSDFRRVYRNLRDPDPILAAMREAHWNVSVGLDVGTTPEHPNVVTWMMRPREIDPHSQCIFVVGEMVRIHLSTRQIAEGIRDEAGRVTTDGIMQFERKHGIIRERIKQRILSHEGKSELLSFTRDCKEYPIAWSLFENGRGSPTAGIDQISNALELMPVPNPFVIDPRAVSAEHDCKVCGSRHANEHLVGCPRIFFLVPDDEARLFVTDDGKLRRSPALTEAGFLRARYEIPGWHYPESEKGKPVKARKPEKGEDDFCLIAGTMVETEHGPQAIETIAPGQRVVTRAGLKTVEDARLTRTVSILYTVVTTDGRTVSGTGNHPIWTYRGWRSLSELTAGDELICLNTEGRGELSRAEAARASLWSSKGSDSTATQIASTFHGGRISSRIMASGLRAQRRSMSRYGRITSATFHRIVKSITAMKTRLTMRLITLSAYPAFGTSGIMLTDAICGPSITSRTSQPSGHLRPTGIKARRVEHGIKSTQSLPSESNSIASFSVSSAANRFGRNVMRSFATTRVKTVMRTATLPQPVFNLAVENNHEYFANGILTHNCDSWRMQMAYWGLRAATATLDEKIETALPAEYKRESIATLTGPTRTIAEQGRYQNYWMTRADVEADERAKAGLSIYE